MTAFANRKLQSHYLKPDRLPDLLAAIQAMAISPRYQQDPEAWATLISGDRTKGTYWQMVFDEHPEFFRASSKHQYALIWRRASASSYHRRQGRILEHSEIAELDEQEGKYLSRPPVPDGQIKTLLDTAINLHRNQVDAYRDRRFWITQVITPVISLLGSIGGAVLGVHLKAG